MWIELSQAEQRLAKYLATMRYRNNRAAGVVDRKIGPQSNEETDLEGIGAELAFCKFSNIYPDLEVNHRPDFDALLPTGDSVDIKATKYQNGHLIAVRRKASKPPDLYALMVGQFPRYRCAGLIRASELLRDEMVKDFGYGESYAASQAQLTPLDGETGD